MKLVLFQETDAGPQLPGLLTERGVVDISGVVRSSYTPQLVMEGIIDDFDRLRPRLAELEQTRLRCRCPRFGCARHCRGRTRFCVRSPTIGSMPSASRARSTCS